LLTLLQYLSTATSKPKTTPLYTAKLNGSPNPSAIIMNSITQLAARSARFNGVSASRQANSIVRRTFTNGMLTGSNPPAKIS